MTLLINALDVMEAKHRYARRHAAPVDESMGLHSAMNSYLCPDKQCICHDLQQDGMDRWAETVTDLEEVGPEDAGSDFVYGACNGHLTFYDKTTKRPATVAALSAYLLSLPLENEMSPETYVGWIAGYIAGMSENHPNRFWDPTPEPEVQS